MAFPATKLDLVIELYINGVWTDVTSKSYARDGVSITRGRADEAVNTDPSTAQFTLNNRSGNFSPRNPVGAYSGQIGRNSPARVRVGGILATRFVAGANGLHGRVYTPDSAPVSVTGDIDIRCDVWLPSWATASTLAHKDVGAGQYSWHLQVSDVIGGPKTLQFYWSDNGTQAGGHWFVAVSTVGVPEPMIGRKAVRVILDVNNGAGGSTATFYTSDTIAGAWTQLGDPVVTIAGVTSIFDSTAGLSCELEIGEYYAFELRNGIAGSVVANPVFTSQASGATSFVDAAGRSWIVDTTQLGELTNRSARCCGEIASWPQKWDTTGRDAYTPVEAAGILRRLGQGGALRSVMYRVLTRGTAGLVAYWPCEDGTTATQVASAVTGISAMGISGTPLFGAATGPTGFACSAAILQTGNAKLTGYVPDQLGAGGVIVLRFLLAVPAGGTTNGAIVARLTCTGSAPRWDLTYGTGGFLSLRAYDPYGTNILDTGLLDFGLLGAFVRVSIELSMGGGNVNWVFQTLSTTGVNVSQSGALAATTIAEATTVVIDVGKNMSDVAVGHISLQNQVTNFLAAVNQLTGFTGETAGARISRLCTEENVAFVGYGDMPATALMGPQSELSLLALLREAAETDGGILFEPRDRIGIAYRPLGSLYNQTAAVTLDYHSHQLTDLVPVDDDQQTRNACTVTRSGGSSATYELASGALSTLDPPAGVGRYDRPATVNTQTDDVLVDQASWRVHLGTVDEARYPQVAVNLASHAMSTNTALSAALIAADCGDLLKITGPPAWLPPDPITQLCQGFTENLNAFQFEWEANCSPGSPWTVAVWDDATYRYTSDGSTVAYPGLTTTGTSLLVAFLSGPVWSHADGDFDINIGGERMTVTNITGGGSPQTFTVTRSVNGVVKTQPVDAVVELWTPAVYAL